MHPRFFAAFFTIAEMWKQPDIPSIDKWIKEGGIHIHTNTHTYIYTHNQLSPGHKKNKILSFATA